MWMFRNGKNQKDAMLTFAVFGFSGVMIRFALSGVTIGTVSFSPLDPTLAGTILAATLGAYVLRRGQDNKMEVALASAAPKEQG